MAEGGRKIGDAFVNVKADTSGMAPQLRKDAERAGDEAGHGFAGKFVAAIAAAAVAVGTLVVGKTAQFIKSAVADASDLNETVSKTGVVFGNSASAIQTWAQTAATKMGQSAQTALDGANAFAIYGKAAGKSGQDLVKFSTGLTELASDVGSFSNVDPAQVIEDFGSALRGEFDPVEKYGILLNETTVKQEALRLGIIKNTKDALTPQQRVLAVQSALYKQTALAQGDFARTSAGLANQQRIVAAQFDNLKTSIGSAFIPAAVAVTTTLSTRLLPQLQQLWQVHGPAVARFVDDAAAKFERWAASVNWDQVSAKIGAFFGSLRSGIPMTDEVSGKASELGANIRKMWESIQDGSKGGGEYASTLNSLKDSTQVFGVVISFVADHLDLLADALPALAVGYGIAKVATIAANVAQAVTPVTTLIAASATRSLAAAHRELAASQAASTAATATGTAVTGANTAATNLGVLARVRLIAETVALKIAELAGIAVRAAATAAQWALNIAMSLNPIGLVIIAVVALVAAFIYLWNNSSAFRNFFISMWDGIWSFMKAVGAWFAGPFANFFVNLWNTIVSSGKTVWTFFSSTLPNAFASLRSYVFGVMGGVKDTIVSRFSESVAYVAGVPGRILGFFAGIGGQFASVGRSIVEGVIHGIQNAMGWLRDTAASIGREALAQAKAAIGFGSPARKFFPVGKSMADGTVVGLHQGLPGVRDAMAELMAPPTSAAGLLSADRSNEAGRAATTLNVYGHERQSTRELVAEIMRELAWEASI